MKKIFLIIICFFGFIPMVFADANTINNTYYYELTDIDDNIESSKEGNITYLEELLSEYHNVQVTVYNQENVDSQTYVDSYLNTTFFSTNSLFIFIDKSSLNTIKIYNYTSYYNDVDLNSMFSNCTSYDAYAAAYHILSGLLNLHGDAITTSSGSYSVTINDQASLFTTEEEKLLEEKMNLVSQYGSVYLLTGNFSSTYDGTKKYAENFFYQKFNDGDSASLFIIDMNSRYLYIYSDGYIYSIITDNVADSITDNAYQSAKAGNYYDCASKVYEQMYTKLSGKQIFTPMKIVTTALLSILLSIILFFCIIWFTTKVKVRRGNSLIKYAKLDFTNQFTESKFKSQRKVYNPPSSSGGGGGGGHSGGGGGGGHSGGGGGHGF